MIHNQYRVELSALQTAVASFNGTLVIRPDGSVAMASPEHPKVFKGSDEVAEQLQKVRPRDYSECSV